MAILSVTEWRKILGLYFFEHREPSDLMGGLASMIQRLKIYRGLIHQQVDHTLSVIIFRQRVAFAFTEGPASIGTDIELARKTRIAIEEFLVPKIFRATDKTLTIPDLFVSCTDYLTFQEINALRVSSHRWNVMVRQYSKLKFTGSSGKNSEREKFIVRRDNYQAGASFPFGSRVLHNATASVATVLTTDELNNKVLVRFDPPWGIEECSVHEIQLVQDINKRKRKRIQLTPFSPSR